MRKKDTVGEPETETRRTNSTAPFSSHGTLTANQVSTVVIRPGPDGLDVVNRSQTGTIWVRIDGTDPVIEAAGSFACLGVRTFAMRVRHQDDVTVTMISDAALKFSVEAIG